MFLIFDFVWYIKRDGLDVIFEYTRTKIVILFILDCKMCFKLLEFPEEKEICFLDQSTKTILDIYEINYKRS